MNREEPSQGRGCQETRAEHVQRPGGRSGQDKEQRGGPRLGQWGIVRCREAGGGGWASGTKMRPKNGGKQPEGFTRGRTHQG